MCIAALPMLGALLSIGQAAVSYSAAQDAADEQNSAYERNWKASIAAANDKYASLNNKTLQEREAASNELLEKKIEAMRARATARVAAAESGTTGLSVNALLGDYVAQESRQAEAIRTNFEIRRQHNEDEGVAVYHQTISRINSVRQAANPSPLGFIFQGLGGAVGAFRPTGANSLATA